MMLHVHLINDYSMSLSSVSVSIYICAVAVVLYTVFKVGMDSDKVFGFRVKSTENESKL